MEHPGNLGRLRSPANVRARSLSQRETALPRPGLAMLIGRVGLDVAAAEIFRNVRAPGGERDLGRARLGGRASAALAGAQLSRLAAGPSVHAAVVDVRGPGQ